MIPKRSGIYVIAHVSSGLVYVGSAVNLARRFSQHRCSLNAGRHWNIRMQRTWTKYGAAAFAFSVVEFVDDKAALLARESEWISRMNAANHIHGFNYLPHGGGWLGGKHKEETKKKISDGNRGKPKPPQTKAAVALANSQRVHSEETKKKLSEAGKRRVYSEETLANMRKAQAFCSQETRAKRSAKLKGRVFTEEHRAKLSAANRARKTTPEQMAIRIAKFQATMAANKRKVPQQLSLL